MKKIANHTPGPWSVVLKGIGRSVRVSISASIKERTVYVAETIGGLDEEESNARLIAAAPELLEALKNMVVGVTYKLGDGGENCRFCDANMDDEGTGLDMHDDDCVVHVARAAIAKARGE